MPTTFTKIASVSVGSGGAATIDFTSIPSTYTDLCVLISARDTAANGTIYLTFNGNGSSYSMRRLNGQGTVASSDAPAFSSGIYFSMTGTNETANTFGNASVYVPNYAGSTNKSLLVDSVPENNGSTLNNELMSLVAGLWSNSAAINRVTLAANTVFAQYSTATLYGVSKS
jgi:hypothetical protein